METLTAGEDPVPTGDAVMMLRVGVATPGVLLGRAPPVADEEKKTEGV